MRINTPLSEISDLLQSALAELSKAARAHESAQAKVEGDYEAARLKLEPLAATEKEKRNVVLVLTNQLHGLTGQAPASGRRKLGDGPKRKYNSTPEKTMARIEKSAISKAIAAGKTKAEATKRGKEVAKAYAVKAGLK
jgi:hypothetical protein